MKKSEKVMGSKDCLDCDWFDGIYGCGCLCTSEEKKYDCPRELLEKMDFIIENNPDDDFIIAWKEAEKKLKEGVLEDEKEETKTH